MRGIALSPRPRMRPIRSGRLGEQCAERRSDETHNHVHPKSIAGPLQPDYTFRGEIRLCLRSTGVTSSERRRTHPLQNLSPRSVPNVHCVHGVGHGSSARSHVLGRWEPLQSELILNPSPNCDYADQGEQPPCKSLHPTANWETCRLVEPRWLNPAHAELNRLLESLTNLLYLVRRDADEPTKVEYYVDYAERCVERARAIVIEQLRSYSPN
jgi:hypothetical protein